jgi:2-keto-4-pentenoate hydratase/2-oxohepta-3-ene-1,7-dioic acid hydratase in catechol pathway
VDALAPGKIVCVGRNYAKHASELGNVVPSEPLIFLKPPSAVIPSGAPIVLPEGVGRVDYEGEIGVVIGTRARHVPEPDAWGVVAGFVAVNDVTARDLQHKDSQWSRAKGFDSFCPLGAVMPLREVRPETLQVITRVNGQERQRGEIGELAFSIPTLIAYISRIMTLEPGDLIATGTPEGVGPLSAGDEVEVTVTGVGSVRNPVVAEDG